MADILEEIVAHKRIEIEERKAFISPSKLYPMVENMLDTSVPSMRQALMKSDS